MDPDLASFPRLAARTLRFTLGEPRDVTVTADGSRVLFVRTPSGTDRSGCLWCFDVESGTEQLLADPAELLGAAGEDLPADERARRERARESGGGIVGYSVDDAATVAVFALSGRIWVCDLAAARSRELPGTAGVIDPRVDPTGRRIAYASGGSLRLIGIAGKFADRVLAAPDGAEVRWGQAEFVAAEEMDRYRGFWWAPDGESLLAERCDNAPVPLWYVADPADPAKPPVPHRYPVAGSVDADVRLWHLGVAGGRREMLWDRAGFPYLTRVSWRAHGDPVIQVMSRDQRRAQALGLDVVTGTTRVLAEQVDDIWVDLVIGVPGFAPGGALVTCVDDVDTRRIAVDGVALSPAGMQVRRVLGVDEAGVLATVSVDPTEQLLVRIGYDGAVLELSSGAGVHSGAAAAGTVAVTSSDLAQSGSRVVVYSGGIEVGRLQNCAASPGFQPRVTLLRTGSRELCTAVLFPREHARGSQRLPVLMAPYGGPHGQLVRQSSRLFLQAQWLADQGFAVVVADGRGTPGRGPAWERAVRDEFATVTLDDQVDSLAGVAAAFPDDVDTSRVGFLGWSYGGYLAALAVLDRPEVFHAAVAGAPVTDWTLYDTFYTERYLGHPAEQPEVYRRNSLLGRADRLTRPLLLVHGLADDNVVVAHTLRLSAALLAAGKPHSVLPLTGVTHMASQEVVAENLLLAQVDFLRRALDR